MYKKKGNNQNIKPPVEVGEELDVVIEAVGEKGDGIAKKNGFVLFPSGIFLFVPYLFNFFD